MTSFADRQTPKFHFFINVIFSLSVSLRFSEAAYNIFSKLDKTYSTYIHSTSFPSSP